IASSEGLLFTEVDSWMTGINRNVEGKQVRRIMRYSGGHPKFRERCEAVVAGGYRAVSLALEGILGVGVPMGVAPFRWLGSGDDNAWEEEILWARLAEELGFDVLWAVEHHFNDYSFCPDNLQLMAYLAALCPNIDLGTAAVILPWNDPLRVAEKAIVLDM